ncbi:TetR/AcrR family transcriptional regulator [Nocardia otitidiscaviarum]|uniref:TetR/AcrR family transcriptional regulator n=1 Tax=Nocardia otitidiscaviarum TaxID=1823 RepID=UPI0004A75E5E|nr:TetR/AcrR family transcriptional regulator [Nocardia otitidiscaviarum]MBF6132599.1 TetR/AcrR family transcriptional regulator [Nocardia otitidiscaviarum]MBF6240723.1 TetR/AcrR family transcriptional regulator [Nocardia otitidiscaviarum]MBF6488700.1 TetR/AcrR family transcriptional regulator [Nocardia otitidiscaviarum]
MESLREKYAENTRQTLIDTAARLFAEREYANLSAEELVRTAGLTRGALYHHFDGKRGLFEAVVELLEDRAAQRIRRAVAAVSDPFERIDRGIAEFLEICAEPDYRQIVLQQGPIALGWRRWRELDQRHLGGLLLEAIRELLAAELIRPYPAELIASALYGALTELPLTITETDDPAHARTLSAGLVHELLGGLATQRP